MPDPIIHHDPGFRFWTEVEGEVAYLAYRQVDDHTVDFVSTWTPPRFRGRGIATAITHHALAWARAQGLTVIPTCSHVRHVIGAGR
jgi:predicted GNAT family acetyltransferase